MNQVWLAFVTGLTTGGLSCLAVQGGLLASSVTTQEKPRGMVTISSFLIAKFIAYAILGFVLGYLGSTLVLSPKLFGVLQIIVGLFMVATVGRLLNLHPIFRYFVIQPPRSVYKIMKGTSAPIALGLLTVLIPCGVTQAMMVLAVGTGSPIQGAAIMAAFILGTSPIFFALGASVVELLKRPVFSYVAAGVIAVFALLSINGGLGLVGSFYTFNNIVRAATTSTDDIARLRGTVAGMYDGVQNVTIQVASNGYQSSATTLKRGVPVKFELVTNNVSGCTRAFTVPEYGISKVLPQTGREEVVFTPMKTGLLAYSCGMGMYTGSFTVIP
ncbi:sulfite exporter TauE/SafE family protein [Candidatus Gottesmanbacteria bacterium]|nr:sulfite exporter TauE/SafE family protein [Candidatus Gottesmanbacteria bacterium]